MVLRKEKKKRFDQRLFRTAATIQDTGALFWREKNLVNISFTGTFSFKVRLHLTLLFFLAYNAYFVKKCPPKCSVGDKLKILCCLMNQMLTYAGVRDEIDLR